MNGPVEIVNNKIIYKGYMMEAYIPESYFKDGLAEEAGTSFYLFGNFETRHYKDEKDTRSTAKKAHFIYPLKFYTRPDSISEEVLDIGYGETKYRVFTYYRNAVLFTDINIIQDAENVQIMVKMIMDGKMDIVDYDKIPRVLQLCKYYNGVDFGTPAIYEESIISDYYRDPKDVSIPARFVAKEKGYRAKGISQREKISFTSTFSGITFEDINLMLTVADNTERMGRKNIVSDVEKLVLGEL